MDCIITYKTLKYDLGDYGVKAKAAFKLAQCLRKVGYGVGSAEAYMHPHYEAQLHGRTAF